MTTQFQPRPSLPPPLGERGLLAWARRNLFSTWYNSVLTLVLGYLLLAGLIPVINWAFIDAVFIGEGSQDCRPGGACWIFIEQRLGFFIYGFYPEDERWRVNVMFALFAIAVVPQFFSRFKWRKWLALFGLTALPVLGYLLISGGSFGLPVVETSRWGGLMLTLILAYVGMVGALPIGILLALGRRSDMPVVRSLCVVFIEAWRAVPLITILFMASVMLPLFLPQGVSFDRLLRALIGLTLFQAVYLAEEVRGGLQAIPKGQYEAAKALGLGYWRSTILVILPQALKIVIPGIANSLISLFKDTTLVLIIGLFDLLGAVKSTLSNPAWQNVATEGYVFVAFCFWLFCFSMSRYSQALERKLDTNHRN